LENDTKVLCFMLEYDERHKMNGQFHLYKANYFLVDDTMEILEVRRSNSGVDPFPKLLSRSKLPKVYEEELTNDRDRGVEDDNDVSAHYSPKDIIVGETIDVWSREVKVVDCDDFTRQWYRQAENFEQPPPCYHEERELVLPKNKPPPWDGYGTPEDSMGSCTHLIPKAPKGNHGKFMQNDRKVLRFQAKKVSDIDYERKRNFIIAFNMANDELGIYEPAQRNSGIIGG